MRPWEEGDAEALFRYAKDPAVGPIAGWPPHSSVADSLHIIRTVLSAPETYALLRKPDREPIGSIGILRGAQGTLPLDETEAEIGYWVGVPYWGQGLIPEAVCCLLRRCFTVLGCQRVWCGYYDGNLQSRRVQEKCGFRYHHTEKNHPRLLMGDIRTAHFTCMTAEEWTQKKTHRIGNNPLPE